MLGRFASDYWIGDLLEGSYLDLEFSRSDFGREDKSDLIKWSLKVPF